MTWYGGEFVAKACKTYWVRPGGRCLGMSLYGLVQGLQRATVTRSLAAGSDRFEERSKYNSLCPSGRPSGWFTAEEGTTAMMLKEPVQLRESFSLRTLSSASLRSPCRTLERRGQAAFSGHHGQRDVPRTGGSLRHLVLRQPTGEGDAQIFQVSHGGG